MSEPLRTIQDGIQSELFREVGRNRFRLWFRDTQVRHIGTDGVTLAVPTEVHRTWLECTYEETLRRAVEHVLGEGIAIHLEVSRRQGVKREVRERLPARPQEWQELLERRRKPATLESFVCEGGDRFPVMLLSQFVHGNGAIDPPAVYLYGDEGTGKTHLLGGLHDAVESHGPGQSVYLTSRRFTQMYVSALRARELEAVRAFEVDFTHRRIVVLDDIDRLSGRKATQQALVRLREQAIGTNTRFVFGARVHPQDLAHVSGTLRSWLMSSVILRLPRPRAEGLFRILDARAQSFGLSRLDPEIGAWILEHTGSVRGAVDVLERWAAASCEIGRPLEAEWLEEVTPSVSLTTREEIIRRAKQVVAAHYDCRPDMLDTMTKERRAAEPRRVAMYLVYRATALPLAEIGVSFGLKSHSSVCRAIRQVREARERDPAVEQVLDGLLSRM